MPWLSTTHNLATPNASPQQSPIPCVRQERCGWLMSIQRIRSIWRALISWFLGCPTQGWRPTKAMQALLADLTPAATSWAGRRLLRHALPEAALDDWFGCAQDGGQP